MPAPAPATEPIAAPAPPPAPRRPHRRTVRLLVLVALALTVALVAGLVGALRPAPPVLRSTAGPGATTPSVPSLPGLRFSRLEDPARTVVVDAAGVTVATLTDGARTATLAGPPRTFADPGTPATVTTSAWVRLLPRAWRRDAQREPWFAGWLTRSLADRSPDVLGVGMQYTTGAPAQTDPAGRQVAGDAGYGPPGDNPEERGESSDFYDYLGVPASFPGLHTKSGRPARPKRPDPRRFRDIDCSGFLRMVFGYRLGYPLLGSDAPGPGLPRRARGMATVGPGPVIVPDRGEPAAEYGHLQPGDLVFFDLDPTFDQRIDHTGIYVGTDSSGHYRFLSSRSTADGPTLGDLAGVSVLDGDGYYAQAFRSARRI